MDKNTTAKLDDFRKKITEAGEHIVFHVFPTKILEMHEAVQAAASSANSPFNASQSSGTDATVCSPSGEDGGPKKRKREDEGAVRGATGRICYPEAVSANQRLVGLHTFIKRECEELGVLVDQVKLWITLTMPKIEDGDNFGVEIQTEVLSELDRVHQSAYNLRDLARQDHLDRAKICSKLIKYPNIEDYAVALKEHDEKHLYMARENLTDIRNLYAVMTDLIHKNISKIRAPKANNSMGLY
ncbi:proteasome activator pa28 [Schizophyllum amplum]|uniref:Proteasome activator pa28 n=1 Tax=Schizophyllum amplum TaxID=97359 RepID=A0A550CMB5_9AGAR|nr:proteasome activator pa28 [Auriculariopsis ampla]